MPNTKISALTDGATAEATDKIPVERSGANRYVTPGYIRTHILGQANTFTGNQTVSGGSLILSGNISAAAWTTNGIRFRGVAATLTDTTSSGTVAAAYTNAYGGNTIAATNSTTFTNYYTTFITQPTAGTNVTLTNRWALGLAGSAEITSGQLRVPIGSKASPSIAFGSNSSSLYARAGTMFCLGDGVTEYYSFQTSSILIRSSNVISWSSSSPDVAGGDLIILRDAAGALAQRNSTNAQTFRVYNTYTDASNYERGVLQWNSNVLEIGAETGGTGTARMTRFISAVAGASTAWELRSSVNTNPRLIFAGTDRSVTLWPESNMLAVVSGGYLSYLDYATGASANHSLLSRNGNGATTYFGIVGAAAGIMQINNGGGKGSGYGASIEMWEMTAPSAPATNGVRIYAEDNGSGKTRLMALFPTGAAQQIAIEP